MENLVMQVPKMLMGNELGAVGKWHFLDLIPQKENSRRIPCFLA